MGSGLVLLQFNQQLLLCLSHQACVVLNPLRCGAVSTFEGHGPAKDKDGRPDMQVPCIAGLS